MAPQASIPVAANVLGTIGTVLWCVQLVPQVWHNWRHKSTEGLPGLMMFLWAICAVPFGVYAIVQRFALPIQLQPQVFCALALVSWAQILYYNNGWTAMRAALVGLVLAAAFGGAEVLLVLTLQGPYAAGVTWPVIFIGVLAAILLAAGLLPPYWEMWKRSGRVVGINFLFLGIDFGGAFFSLLAVCTQDTFDVLGGVLYILCCVLEAGIFLSHLIWMWRFRKQRRQEKEDRKMQACMEPADEEAAVAGAEGPGDVPLKEIVIGDSPANAPAAEAQRPDTAAPQQGVEAGPEPASKEASQEQEIKGDGHQDKQQHG